MPIQSTVDSILTYKIAAAERGNLNRLTEACSDVGFGELSFHVPQQTPGSGKWKRVFVGVKV